MAADELDRRRLQRPPCERRRAAARRRRAGQDGADRFGREEGGVEAVGAGVQLGWLVGEQPPASTEARVRQQHVSNAQCFSPCCELLE